MRPLVLHDHFHWFFLLNSFTIRRTERPVRPKKKMSPRINTAALTWFGTQSVEKPTSVSYDDPARLESEKYSSQPAGGGGTPAITFFLGEDSRKKKEGGRESCCYGFFNFYLSLTTALRFNRGVERKKN